MAAVGGFVSRCLTHLRTTLLRHLPANNFTNNSNVNNNIAGSSLLQHRLAFTRQNYLLPNLSRENNSAAVDAPTTARPTAPTTTTPILPLKKKNEGDDNNNNNNCLDTGLTRNPRLTSPTYEYNAGEPMIHITSLLDTVDIAQVNLLSSYIRQYQPKQWSKGRSFDVAPVEYLAGEMIVNNVNRSMYVDENGDIKQQQQQQQLGSGGGNDVVFLEGILQSTMPNLTSHILHCITHAIDHVAHWSPHPYQLGIRCVESLLYEPHGQLKLHTDSESIYTVVIMLSDPTTTETNESSGADDQHNNSIVRDNGVVVADEDLDYFTGGDFVIEQYKTTITTPTPTTTTEATKIDDCSTTSKSHSTQQQQESLLLLRASPRQGDAIIFDSNSLHGVDTILSGRRRVLVLELWPFDSADEGDLRPSRSAYSHRQKLPEIFFKGGKR